MSHVKLLKNLFAQLNGLPEGGNWRIRDHSVVSVCPPQLLNCLVDLYHNNINIMLLKDIPAKYFLIFCISDNNVAVARISGVVKIATALYFKS
jgi:hypothetical protein